MASSTSIGGWLAEQYDMNANQPVTDSPRSTVSRWEGLPAVKWLLVDERFSQPVPWWQSRRYDWFDGPYSPNYRS